MFKKKCRNKRLFWIKFSHDSLYIYIYIHPYTLPSKYAYRYNTCINAHTNTYKNVENTHAWILEKSVCIQVYAKVFGKGRNRSLIFATVGKIVRQMEIFSLGMAAGWREIKLLIQTSCTSL